MPSLAFCWRCDAPVRIDGIEARGQYAYIERCEAKAMSLQDFRNLLELVLGHGLSSIWVGRHISGSEQ